MKIVPLSIDPDIFDKILSMSSDDIHELVETVGLCTSLNKQLNNSRKTKIITGISMLRNAITILEQCSCQINIQIQNDLWTEQIQYITGDDSLE